ncbi:hypothetical protein SLS56_006659 [Neofusicoccum ribis]|uniref:DUF7907 domain-containing protein n=1 Tax=Neofusicoccum ribis TaxID=45134 RepID=A0ABR3SQ81_9PEZI
MYTPTLLITALAAASASAQQRPTSNTFTLRAFPYSGTDLTPSIENYELNAVASDPSDPYPCSRVASLSPPGQGGLWYANGTYSVAVSPGVLGPDARFTCAGIQAAAAGTATVPATWPVTVDCGPGTEGISVQISSGTGAPVLSSDTLSWMACPASQLGRPVDFDEGTIVLVPKADGQRRLGGCAEVMLVAYCVDGEGGEGAVEVPCV